MHTDGVPMHVHVTVHAAHRGRRLSERAPGSREPAASAQGAGSVPPSTGGGRLCRRRHRGRSRRAPGVRTRPRRSGGFGRRPRQRGVAPSRALGRPSRRGGHRDRRSRARHPGHRGEGRPDPTRQCRSVVGWRTRTSKESVQAGRGQPLCPGQEARRAARLAGGAEPGRRRGRRAAGRRARLDEGLGRAARVGRRRIPDRGPIDVRR